MVKTIFRLQVQYKAYDAGGKRKQYIDLEGQGIRGHKPEPWVAHFEELL